LWLAVYADVVTLLFTFFVLLISLSVIDARSRSAVLDSLSSTFGGSGTERRGPVPDAPPGTVGEGASATASLYALVAGDKDNELDFQENNSVQILSVGADALFIPDDAVPSDRETPPKKRRASQLFLSDDTVLSDRGRELLDTLLPHLMSVGYPVRVEGHSAPRRDEEGAAYVADPDNRSAGLTWLRSFRRALAVYRRLEEIGVPRERLGMAAYGSSRPRFSENSPEGRRKNRRVDIVLDGRDREHMDSLEALREKDGIKREMYYRGFRFDLGVPGDPPGAVSGGASGAGPDGGRGERRR
jgi:chemotaxis protein MotB